MGETADIRELEATIATLLAQLEATSRDNEALAADNRELASEASRLATSLADRDVRLAELAAKKDRQLRELAARKDAELEELVRLKDQELKELAASKDRAYAQLKGEHDRLVELIKQANARAFGAKSERVLPHQISLFNDVEAAAGPQAAVSEVTPTGKRRRPKRRVDWSRFKTTIVTHELVEGERDCPACGRHMEPMGYEVRREFVYVPARIEVREHRIAKYVCRACSKVNERGGGERPASIVQAAGPSLPLPGAWASPELLAHVMRQKFELSMPIYRIASDLSSQQGLPLSRQTLCGWVMGAHERWLAMLYELIKDEVRSSDIIQCDETSIQVLKEPRRRPAQRSYMWLFASPACKRPAYAFEYHPTRGRCVVESFLKGWSGTIVSDGYAAYDNLGPTVRRVSCIVHIRRPFFRIVRDLGGEEAARKADSVALQALKRIRAIVALDNSLDGLDPKERKTRRDKEMRPLMEDFYAWAKETRNTYAAPNMALSKALDYAISQWPHLMVALDDGRLPIDNNLAEQAIRPFAVGRKNWLFSDTQAGAHASAAIYSLVTTARANGLKAYDYLRWVLAEMPKAKDAGTLDPARFLPWSQDVPKDCRAAGDEQRSAFCDDPVLDVDVEAYEGIVG